MASNAERARRKGGEDGRLGRNFVLLFFLCLFANCYNSIYYCFEQWLEQVGVDPGWRGILLGAVAAMVLLTRPGASVAVLRLRLRPVLVASLLANTGVLLSYQFLPAGTAAFVWIVLGVRLVQGFALAVFSACTVAMMAMCIPPNRSAQGFALFTLSFLLPNAALPTVGEALLPVLGGEPALYAATALLAVPALVMIRMLGHGIDAPISATAGSFREHAGRLLAGIRHSGAGWVYLSNFAFSMAIFTCLFFMKGLCGVTGELPARFFLLYSLAIVVVRVFCSGMLDRLPKLPVVPVSCLAMGGAALTLAWGPSWTYETFSVIYGLTISLLYPLLYATVYERSTPELRPVASNLVMLMGDAAALVSPLLGGAVLAMGAGYRGVVTMAGCCAAASGVIYLVDWAIRRVRGRARA